MEHKIHCWNCPHARRSSLHRAFCDLIDGHDEVLEEYSGERPEELEEDELEAAADDVIDDLSSRLGDIMRSFMDLKLMAACYNAGVDLRECAQAKAYDEYMDEIERCFDE